MRRSSQGAETANEEQCLAPFTYVFVPSLMVILFVSEIFINYLIRGLPI
jgi:hypothetical protein